MFGKMLMSVGIGAAKVDAQIHSGPVEPGGLITGEVKIKGGKSEQEINEIHMVLSTDYEAQVVVDGDQRTEFRHCELCIYDIAEGFTIGAGEEKAIPFEIEVPFEAPATFGHQRLHLRTALGVSKALDPSDNDEIEVLPDPIAAELLAQAEALGFEHTHDSGRCRFSANSEEGVPFVQRFELRPRSGPFRGVLDSVDFFFDVYPEGVEVFAVVDRRSRGLGAFVDEITNVDEEYERFSIERESGPAPDELEGFLNHVLSRR